MKTNTDYGWFAGIIDGEGCFQIAKLKRGESVYYTARISVTNTNQAIVERCKELGGGSLRGPYPVGKDGTCKPMFYWGVKCRGAERVANLILPHLVAKIESARILLLLTSRIQSGAEPGRWGRAKLGEEENETRETLKLAINALNHRGGTVMPREYSESLRKARIMLEEAGSVASLVPPQYDFQQR